MTVPIFQPGDIVCRFRPQYKGWFKYLVTRLILFFTTEHWLGEKTSTVYHTEMFYGYRGEADQPTCITMEPPECRLRRMPHTRLAVFRLRDKPAVFDGMFKLYCEARLGQRYDFVKIVAFVLDWLFWTKWFSERTANGGRDVCSEFTARFYHRVGRLCSLYPADCTTPDDIYDFVREYPEIFELIYEEGRP